MRFAALFTHFMYNGLPARFPVLGKNVKAVVKAARESQLGFPYVSIYCRMAHDVCTVKFTIVTSRQENVITVFILTSFIQMNINVVIKYL